ncbi:hypothetical protein [Kiloniella majae]|uniref:hypothetical protein n=1 Tax=Kiloniella majae TaxID=1938558 RepID=UPI000A2793F6|nr:hypothetical protein [Kiloniella majae]
MPSTYKLKEPVPVGATSSPFCVGGRGVPSFECFRILCGSVDIEIKSTGQTSKFRHCYISQQSRRPNKKIIEKIVDVVFDGTLSLSDVETFLKKTRGKNHDFWEELRNELLFCIFAKKRDRNVEAFLHLYRMLELISVALPLIYARKLDDYRDAMKFIKSLSKNNRDSDLAVLRYFTEEIAKGNSTFSRLQIDYSFDGIDTRVATEIETQLSKYIFSDEKIKHTFFMTPNEGVSVGFSSVSLFIASCRNRLFHNASTKNNFKLDPLHGAEPICSVLIEPSLNWFGIILSEIMKSESSKYI